MSLVEFNGSLPIFDKRDEILEALRGNQVVIIAGDTGSGKTTRLPGLCLEAGRGRAGRIVCSQPRRIAALSLSRYVGTLFPDQPIVGYRVRFRDRIEESTRVAFVTDGILLAEISRDPALSGYDTIIVDEAHERTLNIDFLLGYLRTLLPRRPDLSLVISSATLDTALFSRNFHHAPVITVSGRLYPIEVRYKPAIAMWDGTAMRSHIDAVLLTLREIIDSREDGDVLVFLPTVDDIVETASCAAALLKGSGAEVLTLYGRMSPEEQQRVFEPHRERHVIFATNIAETSVTVPGIRFVIDSGLARSVRFDPGAGITRMPVERISQASARQRAGRCGRVRDGVCIRLYSEADYGSRPRFTLPEIKRVNLSGMILRMAALNLGSAEKFPFLQRPSPGALAAGYRRLGDLGAVDKKGALTRLGRAMAALPLDPSIARMLLYSREHGAFPEVAVIAAALSAGDPCAHCGPTPGSAISPAWIDPESDFLTFVNIWKRLPLRDTAGRSSKTLSAFCEQYHLSSQRVREWIDVHRQLLRICRRLRTRARCPEQSTGDTVHKSLLSGLASNLAIRQDNGLYRTGHAHDIAISPGSRLFKKHRTWLLFHDIVETKRPYGRAAATIRPEWIQELFPRQCRVAYEDPRFDPESGLVIALEQVMFKGLTLIANRRVDYGPVRREAATEIFIEQALVQERIGAGFRFVEKNREVRDSIYRAVHKLRDRSLYRGEQALIEFYQERLDGVNSVAQLRHRLGRDDNFLCARELDLLPQGMPPEIENYPDQLLIGNIWAPLRYEYNPGSPDDGATVTVPVSLFEAVPLYYWEWLLPAFRRKRIEALLEGSREFRDCAIGDMAERVDMSLRPSEGSFINDAMRAAGTCAGGRTISARWRDAIPEHLWLRVNVTNEKGVCVGTCRPPLESPAPSYRAAGMRSAFWAPWCASLERECIEDMPDETLDTVHIGPPGQLVPLCGIRALAAAGDSIALRVFVSRDTAVRSHYRGIKELIERSLSEEIAWASRDLKLPEQLLMKTRTIISRQALESLTERLFREMVIEAQGTPPRNRAEFDTCREQARERIKEAPAQAVALIKAIYAGVLGCREILDKMTTRFPGELHASTGTELFTELERYLEPLCGTECQLDKVRQLPRYLKAFAPRIETAYLKRGRYRSCMEQLRSLRSSLAAEPSCAALSESTLGLLRDFECSIEEYAISLFANGKVAPLFPVSCQRLNQKLELLRASISAG